MPFLLGCFLKSELSKALNRKKILKNTAKLFLRIEVSFIENKRLCILLKNYNFIGVLETNYVYQVHKGGQGYAG
jgi:hypothetical protein